MIRYIAFGTSGKIEKFSKDTIGSGKQPYPCQSMFLPTAIIGYQKCYKLLKIVIGDGRAAINTGFVNGNTLNDSPNRVRLIHLLDSGWSHWQSRCDDN